MSVWDVCPMCGCEDVYKIVGDNQWKCGICEFIFEKGKVYYSEVGNPDKWE